MTRARVGAQALSLRLDPDTIHFFFNAERARLPLPQRPPRFSTRGLFVFSCHRKIGRRTLGCHR